jgi:hypothetical protein
MYRLALSVLKGEHEWLEQGIASGDTEMGPVDEPSNRRDVERFSFTSNEPAPGAMAAAG